MTEWTITDETALRSELAEIRADGYAVDWVQQVMGMGLVAASLIVEGRVEGSVGIVCPTGRVKDQEYRRMLLQKLQECIDSITIKYRYGL